MTLPATGTLSYNGYTFSSFAETSVVIQPRSDEAGWTSTISKYTFTVRDYVQSAGSATDNTLQSIRSQLLAYGQELHYDGKGLGSVITVGKAGTTALDATWGPKPISFTYIPRGNNLGAKIEWVCEVTIADCSATSSTPTLRKPMAFNYDFTWNINDEGMTTRTITGYVEIALSRRSGRSVEGDANTLRRQVTPLPLLGFSRVQSFRLSKDRRRLDFTITDIEQSFPMPDGLVKCSCEQTVESAQQQSFVKWTVTFSGSVTTAPGQPKSIAMQKINLIVSKRIRAAVRAVALGKAQKGDYYSMVRCSISESIFERVTNFTIVYLAYNNRKLSGILEDTNMWVPIAGPNGFNTWRTSVADTALDPFGAAKLTYNSSRDAIVDICGGFETATGKNDEANNEGNIQGKQAAPAAPPDDQIERPTPENSWLEYDCKVYLDVDLKRVVHKALNGATKSGQVAPPSTITDNLGKVQKNTQGPTAGVYSGVEDIVQTVAAPSCRIRLVGYGVRLGYPVTVPELVFVGGQRVVADGRLVQQGAPKTLDGVLLIYTTAWELDYIVPRPPIGPLPVPTNPAEDGQGG